MLLWWKLVGVLRGIPTKVFIGAGLVLVVVVLLWLWRNSIIDTVEMEQKLRSHEAYQKTQEAISNALESIRGATPADAREWLRNYGAGRH